jgi:RNA polymerase sigma factor (sigma-70 family)
MEPGDFEHVYREHCDRVYRYCAFRTNSASDAEDLTADVFVALMNARRPPRPDYLLPWLYRVAQRKCATHHRRSLRNVPVADVPDSPIESPECWSDSAAWQATAKLPGTQQLIIYLRVIEGRAFEEISELAGKRSGATKMLYYRAMESLRMSLPEEGTS